MCQLRGKRARGQNGKRASEGGIYFASNSEFRTPNSEFQRGIWMEKLAIAGGQPVKDEFLPIFRLSLDAEDYEQIKSVLDSGQISRGSYPQVLEQEFAAYVGCQHAVVLNSGTAALHLATKSLELSEGSEVIVPSLSFVATAFAPLYCGLKPVFAEIEADTFNISPEDIERKITDRTKAIISVDYAGQPANLSAINEIAQRHRLVVIEDAAHAVGAQYGTQKIGNISDLTAFSFFATKNITGGEGGMVTTNNEEWAQKIRLMKAHGIKPLENTPKASGYYDVVSIGYNCHLSNINIALILSQLKQIEKLNSMRRQNAEYLTSLLVDLDCVQFANQSRQSHLCEAVPSIGVFHLYTIQLALDRLSVSRDEIIRALLAEGIGVGVYYRPIHLFSYFRQQYGYKEGDLPVTEEVTSRLLTLPMYPQLTRSDLEDIYTALKKVLNAYSR